MRIAKSAGFLLMAVLAQPALAQKGSADAAGNFPLRPIRIVIPFTPGSNSDMLARLIGPKMLERWGQQVVVDNRPGAGGSIAGGIVVSSIADGHTLMLSSSAFATSAALGLKLPYDPLRDFAGVTQVASTANVLLVAPSLGVKSAKDLIALAQQKRGQINFASSGVGSGTHYTGELFKLAAKIDVVHVPYKGTPEALTDTMAGRVHYYFSPIMPALSMIKNGRLLALGVTTVQRAPLLPDVPSLGEAALPGFQYDGWFGVWAPAKTPRKTVTAISREIGRILDLPDVKERIVSQGATPKASTPMELDRLVRVEVETRGKVLKAAGASGN
jgi:tripartite-type tricarboxylate transporter receptor subunit TctC